MTTQAPPSFRVSASLRDREFFGRYFTRESVAEAFYQKWCEDYPAHCIEWAERQETAGQEEWRIRVRREAPAI